METSITTLALVLSAIVASVIFLSYVGLSLYIKDRSRRLAVVEKIQNPNHLILEGGNLSETSQPISKKSVLNLLGFLGNYFIKGKAGVNSQTKLNLVRAGFRGDKTESVFWGLKCVLGIGLPVTFFFLRIAIFKLIDPNITAGMFMLLSIAGFYLPNIVLKMKISSRKDKISRGIPDALDILVVCVEAGMGLDAAMNRVADESKLTNKPLSEEFKIYNLELRAGKTRQEALKDLAERTDIEEIRHLSTLLIQTDKFGTSIAQALRTYSDSFRSKRFLKAEEIAAKLPVKLVVPLILCIFPALFVAIAGPAVIRIFHALIKP